MSTKSTNTDRSAHSGADRTHDPAKTDCGESPQKTLPNDCRDSSQRLLRDCIDRLQRLSRDCEDSQQTRPEDGVERQQRLEKGYRNDQQRLGKDDPQRRPADRGDTQQRLESSGEERQQGRSSLSSQTTTPTSQSSSMSSARTRRRGLPPPPLSTLPLSPHPQPPLTSTTNPPPANASQVAAGEEEDDLDVQVRFFNPADDVFDPDPAGQDGFREAASFPAERCSRCLSAGGSSDREGPPPVSPGRRSPGSVLLKRNSSSLQPISEQEMLTLMERTDLQEVLSILPPCQCDACLLTEAESLSLSSSSSSSSLSSLAVVAASPPEGSAFPVAETLEPRSSSPPPPPPPQSTRLRRQSSWKKIRSIIRWSPFIQVFKKHRYPWIQLAGHQGNFQAGEAGSVLKKLDSREHQSFQRLMHDRLQPYVPEFRGVVEKNGERYVQLQDLLCEFNSPCVMDIKMGVRTYLEEELTKARKKPTLRKDMYQKMVDVDSNAPTAEEHQQRAVTKPRYMQWRDQMSSSVDLGFRIEGIKKSDGASSKDFKKTKSRDSVADILKTFIGDDETVLAKYLQRLREICSTQESSEFFQSHEVIGSSLLFVHDSQGEVNVWMIDFGKTEPLPKGVSINHRSTWIEGNHEDGYLFGLDNIISMLEELQASSMA